MERAERVKQLEEARHVFIVTLGLNLLVSVSKLSWGLMSKSLSMTADGLHSLLDASANVVGIIGISISAKPPDKGHPYGHRKFEALAAICISFLMFLASYEVLSESARRLASRDLVMPEVSFASYAIMISTAIINLFVSKYEEKRGKELKSPLLIADSQHTMSDVFVTAAVLISLLAVQIKYPLADIVVSGFVVLAILKAGFGIISANMGSLVDASIIDPEFIAKVVMSVPGVKACHRIRSRGLVDSVFIDLHIQVAPELSIQEAHEISTRVETAIKQQAGGVVDVLVHTEEYGDPPEDL